MRTSGKKESFIQSSFFDWLSRCKKEYRPYCFAIPNGGSRHILEAVNLKRQGVTAGVPDVFCALSRKGFHGLFIEFKAGKNKLTELQRQMISKLAEQGYQCTVCYDVQSAIDNFNTYIED
jgi:hypothetical protein